MSKKKKQIKNDKGEIVPEKCPYCGSDIKIYIKGEPVYLCSNKDCEHYFGTVPCHINELQIILAIDKGLRYALNLNYRRQLMKGTLTESLHEFKISPEIIKDLESIIYKNINKKYFYTGYNFNYDKSSKKFEFLKEEDDTKHIPIYVTLENIENDEFHAGIDNRIINGENHNKINIIVNTFNYNKYFIYVALKHEFIHLILMYKFDRFNNLNSLKNTVPFDIDNVPMKEFIMNLLYIMAPTEQEAHINGYCQYIDNLIEQENIPNQSLSTCIEKIMFSEDGNKASYLLEFYEKIQLLEEQLSYGNISLTMYIGYYLTKHHIIYSNINKLFIENFKKIPFNERIKFEKEAYDILELIKFKYKKYKSLLYTVTYNKMKDFCKKL